MTIHGSPYELFKEEVMFHPSWTAKAQKSTEAARYISDHELLNAVAERLGVEDRLEGGYLSSSFTQMIAKLFEALENRTRDQQQKVAQDGLRPGEHA